MKSQDVQLVMEVYVQTGGDEVVFGRSTSTIPLVYISIFIFACC